MYTGYVHPFHELPPLCTSLVLWDNMVLQYYLAFANSKSTLSGNLQSMRTCEVQIFTTRRMVFVGYCKMLMTFLKPVLEIQHQPLVEGSLKTSDSNPRQVSPH